MQNKDPAVILGGASGWGRPGKLSKGETFESNVCHMKGTVDWRVLQPEAKAHVRSQKHQV